MLKEKKMRVKIDSINGAYVVAVISSAGTVFESEKHDNPQSAAMAAKFLSVEHDCPIESHE
jgi:hypothetical protein